MRNLKRIFIMAFTVAMVGVIHLTAFAAAGWVKTNGRDQYLDSNGYAVTDSWRKSGDYWYYLDSDGYMAVSRLIDDGSYYVVNDQGVMLTNQWAQAADDDGEINWYYLQSTGKAKENGFLTIGGVKYHFTEGKMDTGWIQDDDTIYYLKDSGEITTGWQYIDDLDSSDEVSIDESGWYYFDTNGRMVKDAEKKVGNSYYVFDGNGLMLDNWVEFTSGSNTIYKYYRPSSGDRMEGWVYLEEKSTDEGRETEEGWYYFKKGVPYTAGSSNTTAISSDYGVARINSEVYCFDRYGKMVTGRVDSSNDVWFYFDESSGKMQEGKVTITNSDDLDDGTYYFADSGRIGDKGGSFTGVAKGYLYQNGQLVCAEEGMRYQQVSVDGKTYMVNESGKIVTSGTVKDDNGDRWKITKNADGSYNITKVN